MLSLKKTIAAMLLLIITSVAVAGEPALTIVTASGVHVFTRSQLLRRHHLEKMTMRDSRAYSGVKMQYTVLRLCDLLRPYHISHDSMIELVSTDKFTALVPAKLLLTCAKNSAVAYLAIEPKDQPWPHLQYNNPDQAEAMSAGPFQIVWRHPEKSYISNEYWAWKLSAVKVLARQDASNSLVPQTHNEHIRNGYQAYVSRCLGCHTINHIGKATIGPDLNKPVSVVKRFHDDELLKKFIRDPQSVRAKKNDRMSGTSETFLTNRDLDDLISYLHFMSSDG